MRVYTLNDRERFCMAERGSTGQIGDIQDREALQDKEGLYRTERGSTGQIVALQDR